MILAPNRPMKSTFDDTPYTMLNNSYNIFLHNLHNLCFLEFEPQNSGCRSINELLVKPLD